jgi:diacylglycerol kinase family enzyme
VRTLLVVNPRATAVTPRRVQQVTRALAPGLDVTVRTTRAPLHAAELARRAAEDGVEAVVVYAGDGTLNEAANGLTGHTTALAALPGGSTNVFARAAGWPAGVAAAAPLLRDALLARRTARVGVGLVNGRRFLFNCGIGFDAAVVARAERRSDLKRAAAPVWFAASAVTTWLRHYDRDLRFVVTTGAGTAGVGCVFAIVSRLSPYTYFGRWPLVVSPAAGLDRGLAVAGFTRLDLPLLVRVAASALRARGALDHPAVHQWKDLHDVGIDSDRPVPYQVDGEYLGETTSLRFRHEPDALTVVLPGAGR